MLKHLAGNGGASNGRRAELRRVPADDQHLAELYDLAGLAVDPVDPNHVLGGDPILFAACPDDCEHLSSSCVRSRCSDDPDRLLSVGLLFVFKGLIGPRKSTRTQGPARHAYGGETGGLSRNPTLNGARQEAGANINVGWIRSRFSRAPNPARQEHRLRCPIAPGGSRRPVRSPEFWESPGAARSFDAACARRCASNACRAHESSPRPP